MSVVRQSSDYPLSFVRKADIHMDIYTIFYTFSDQCQDIHLIIVVIFSKITQSGALTSLRH